MATLSVEATQVSWTDVVVGVVAAKLVGTLGTVVSTIQVFVAGDGSGIPLTVAKTVNVWEPWTRPPYALGLVHEPGVPLSSLQVNEAPPFDVNEKLADVLELGLAGELVIVVSGTWPAASATPPESEVATPTIATAASTVSRRVGARAPSAVRLRCMSVPPTATHGYGSLRGWASPSSRATARGRLVSTFPPVHTGTGV